VQQSTQPDQLANVRALARLLDSAVQVPGTRIRFGLDALLGLIPVVGDTIGAAMGTYILLVASRLGVSGPVLARMTLNLGIDALLGAIPLVGDLFDLAWRGNVRNVALLERALVDPQATRRSSLGVLAGVGLASVLLAAGVVALAVWFLPSLFEYLGQGS
jgi:hypothetical protein